MSKLTTSRSQELPYFFDRERAEKNLERIRQRVPKTVGDAIPSLLADVPDPDSALNLFERLTEEATPELFRLFERHRSLVHYALILFGYSQFLGETLLHNTDLLAGLLREENLDRSHSREEFREAFARFRSRSFETDIASLLARFKRREYVRIVLRDVLGLATISETTSEISALSDVLIDEALQTCASTLHAKYGLPEHKDKQGRISKTAFTVLALGKLGGNELNYSSDIDLMFLYGDGENLSNAPITNREYFVKLAQQVTDVLSRITKEGFVFRIDLRLRPQGREGESAVALSQALRYYTDEAHDWERQAMIKVRHCAGDVALARQFIRNVQESVYTEHINFPAIETALKTRDRIQDRRRSARHAGLDVKLDPGGIRDIEFLVQCLQRVYGGKEKWLRSGGTLFSLQKLHDKQHITGRDFQQLTTAYEFLRSVEHRLQLRRGQQTHRLPTSQEELAIVARSLRNDLLAADNVLEVIRDRMQEVSVIYDRIIHQQQQQTEETASEDFELRTLDLSFGRVQSDLQILHRLAAENSPLHPVAARTDVDPHTRRNLFRFLSSSFTSAERYAAVAKNPELVDKALQLFRQSEFLTDILARHPEDVANLADVRRSSSRHQAATLFNPDDPIRSSHSELLESYIASEALPHTEKLTLLRRRFRHRIFLSGAHDIFESRPVFASYADTTIAAEEAISAALAITRSEGIAIMALGRLGTREFDILSDADLVFIRRGDLESASATRVAEDVMHALSAYTSEGTVLAVDVRLRPHGNDGDLTVTPDHLQRYFAKEAQPWEALTYTKLRFIAGNEHVAAQAVSAADKIYQRFGSAAEFASAVREMRTKLEDSEPSNNIKTGSGGLYDIDFAISYLLIRHGIRTVDGNTRQRLQKLGQSKLINERNLQILLDALEFWRTLEHATRLATGRSQRSIPVGEHARRSVEELMSQVYNLSAGDLDSTMESTREAVRPVFDALVRA